MTPRSSMSPELARRAGFTIVELVIALAIGVGILAAAWGVTSATAGATDVTVRRTRLTLETSRALQRITQELMESGTSTMPIVPIAPVGGSSLRYRQAIGFSNSTIDWGPEKQVEMRSDPSDPQDGIDNDGDGLTDECIVVLVVNPGAPGELEQVLVREVAWMLDGETENGLDDNNNGLVDERGFSLVVDGETLIIRLCREAETADGRVIASIAQTSVSLRNG